MISLMKWYAARGLKKMFNVIKMSSGLYAKEFHSIEDSMEDAGIYLDEGTPVMLCDELEDLEELGIDVDDITIVDDE